MDWAAACRLRCSIAKELLKSHPSPYPYTHTHTWVRVPTIETKELPVLGFFDSYAQVSMLSEKSISKQNPVQIIKVKTAV